MNVNLRARSSCAELALFFIRTFYESRILNPRVTQAGKLFIISLASARVVGDITLFVVYNWVIELGSRPTFSNRIEEGFRLVRRPKLSKSFEMNTTIVMCDLYK